MEKHLTTKYDTQDYMAVHSTLKDYLDGCARIPQNNVDKLINYAKTRFINNKQETLYRFEVDGTNSFRIVSTSRSKLTAKKVGRSRFKDIHFNNYKGNSWKIYEVKTTPLLTYENIEGMMLELYRKSKRRSVKTCLSILKEELECIVLREALDDAVVIDCGVFK